MFTLRLDDGTWTVTHAGGSFPLEDSRGLQMLYRLVCDPGRDLHVLDLAGRDLHDDSPGVLDAAARAAVRSRLERLKDEIEAEGDDAERARGEFHALVAALARSPGGDRRSVAASERARVHVERHLAAAVEQIAAEEASLGRHLRAALVTGMFCRYK